MRDDYFLFSLNIANIFPFSILSLSRALPNSPSYCYSEHAASSAASASSAATATGSRRCTEEAATPYPPCRRRQPEQHCQWCGRCELCKCGSPTTPGNTSLCSSCGGQRTTSSTSGNTTSSPVSGVEQGQGGDRGAQNKIGLMESKTAAAEAKAAHICLW